MKFKHSSNLNNNTNTIIINLPNKTQTKRNKSPTEKNQIQSMPLGDNRFTTVLQQTPQLNRDYLNINDKLNRLENVLQKPNSNTNDTFDVPQSTNSLNFIPQGNPRTFFSSSSSFRPITNNSIIPTPNYLTQPTDEQMDDEEEDFENLQLDELQNNNSYIKKHI